MHFFAFARVSPLYARLYCLATPLGGSLLTGLAPNTDAPARLTPHL